MIVLGIAAGGTAAFAMGFSPSWFRVVVATILGFAVGATIDVGLTVLSGPTGAHGLVLLPVYKFYGFTETGLIAITFSLVGAAGAALRNHNRIRGPNDLRA